MHPRCRHIGETYLNVDFSSSAQVKFKFELSWKKKLNFWFPCCSTREDLSIDVSITNVGLISTKPGWFLGVRKLGVRTEFNFVDFQLFEKIHIFEFPWWSTREDHSIDVSITNVGLILTKLRWFQLFVKNQNSNFELFWKKIKFLGFHGEVLVETFPLMYQLLM